MKTFLCLVLLASGYESWAQELPDAGLPDASVGEGGADRGDEEDESSHSACLDSKSCNQGFACVDGRCIPQKPISVGCQTAPWLTLPTLLLAWARRRSRAGPLCSR